MEGEAEVDMKNSCQILTNLIYFIMYQNKFQRKKLMFKNNVKGNIYI